MQKLDSQADGEQAAEGPGIVGEDRTVWRAAGHVKAQGTRLAETRFAITDAGEMALAKERLDDLSTFLYQRFGIRLGSRYNAPQAAMDKLDELQRRLVRGNGK